MNTTVTSGTTCSTWRAADSKATSAVAPRTTTRVSRTTTTVNRRPGSESRSVREPCARRAQPTPAATATATATLVGQVTPSTTRAVASTVETADA
jgi:hypothetical protein